MRNKLKTRDEMIILEKVTPHLKAKSSQSSIHGYGEDLIRPGSVELSALELAGVASIPTRYKYLDSQTMVLDLGVCLRGGLSSVW
ncbi:unnamed protein product, partial [Iphiclides podalirius]